MAGGAPWTSCSSVSLERDAELLQRTHELPWGPLSGTEGLVGLPCSTDGCEIPQVICIAPSQLFRDV